MSFVARRRALSLSIRRTVSTNDDDTSITTCDETSNSCSTLSHCQQLDLKDDFLAKTNSVDNLMKHKSGQQLRRQTLDKLCSNKRTIISQQLTVIQHNDIRKTTTTSQVLESSNDNTSKYKLSKRRWSVLVSVCVVGFLSGFVSIISFR